MSRREVSFNIVRCGARELSRDILKFYSDSSTKEKSVEKLLSCFNLKNLIEISGDNELELGFVNGDRKFWLDSKEGDKSKLAPNLWLPVIDVLPNHDRPGLAAWDDPEVLLKDRSKQMLMSLYDASEAIRQGGRFEVKDLKGDLNGHR